MILVTGGAGFIGSNLVAAFDEAGEDVVVCDRLRDGDKWRNLAKRRLADFVAPEQLMDYLASADSAGLRSVVHMGAVSSTTVTDGDLVMDSNFRLSCRLFDYCAARGLPFIYASSAATYGDGSQGFVDDEASVGTLRPLNLYGWSKTLFDRWLLRELQRARPLPPQWAGLKFFNVYGPNEYHKGSMQSVVSHVFRAVRRGEPARLFKSYRDDYPDGGQRRDFVYVKDCVEIVRWLQQAPAVSGLFNVGSGAARSFHDLAIATQEACGLTPRVEFIDMPETLREKYQYFTQANMRKLRAAGYPGEATSLEAGIRDYVQNYLMLADPYR